MLAAMARRPQIEVEGAATAKTFERGGSEAVIEAAERLRLARRLGRAPGIVGGVTRVQLPAFRAENPEVRQPRSL